MKWNHLPMAGGLFDQNPVLIDRFYYILAERSAFQEQQRKKEEAKQKRGRGLGTSRPG